MDSRLPSPFSSSFNSPSYPSQSSDPERDSFVFLRTKGSPHNQFKSNNQRRGNFKNGRNFNHSPYMHNSPQNRGNYNNGGSPGNLRFNHHNNQFPRSPRPPFSPQERFHQDNQYSQSPRAPFSPQDRFHQDNQYPQSPNSPFSSPGMHHQDNQFSRSPHFSPRYNGRGNVFRGRQSGFRGNRSHPYDGANTKKMMSQPWDHILQQFSQEKLKEIEEERENILSVS